MLRYILPLVLCVLSLGCQQQYYKITDLSTNKDYYTKGWLDGMYRPHGGGIRFKELATGDEISFQNSRVKPVTAEEAAKAASK